MPSFSTLGAVGLLSQLFSLSLAVDTAAITTTLGLIYNGPSGAPEYQVATNTNGKPITWSRSYFIMGNAGEKSEHLAYMAQTVTGSAQIKSRTLNIHETTLPGGSVTTILTFADATASGASPIKTKTASTLPNPTAIQTVVPTVDGAGKHLTQTFVETTYSQYATLKKPTTISSSTLGTVIPIVIGVSGVGWAVPVISNKPIAPPTNLPGASSQQVPVSIPTGDVSTVAIRTVGGKPVSETFVGTTYAKYSSLTAPTTITTSTQGTAIPIVIGIEGFGWNVPVVSGTAILPPQVTAPNPLAGKGSPGTKSGTPSTDTAKPSNHPSTGIPSTGTNKPSNHPSTSTTGPITTYSSNPTIAPVAIITGTSTYKEGGHDDNGFPILPLLCWFCPLTFPKGAVGWSLPKWPSGIYPGGGPPPPGFPTPFPPITIAPNGDPKFSSEPPKSDPTASTNKKSSTSTSKSKSCTTQTAPTCSVTLSVTTSGTVTQTKSITSCGAITKCDATGNTKTTSISATGGSKGTGVQWAVAEATLDSQAVLEKGAQEILSMQADSSSEDGTAPVTSSTAKSTSTSGSQKGTTTKRVTTGTTHLPTNLPTLSKACVTSTLVNCKWIYNDAGGKCPTKTEMIPASCTQAKTTQVQAPPSPTASPYTKGTCRLDIAEAAHGNTDGVDAYLKLHDVTGKELKVTAFNGLKYDAPATLSAKDTKLPFDVSVDFTGSLPKRRMGKRNPSPDRPPPPSIEHEFDFEGYPVQITAGATKWTFLDKDTTKMPYCNVGQWDTGSVADDIAALLGLGNQVLPNRKADCYFTC